MNTLRKLKARWMEEFTDEVSGETAYHVYEVSDCASELSTITPAWERLARASTSILDAHESGFLEPKDADALEALSELRKAIQEVQS